MRGISMILIVGFFFGAWAATSFAETMRCGNDYININDSAFIVVDRPRKRSRPLKMSICTYCAFPLNDVRVCFIFHYIVIIFQSFPSDPAL